MRVIGYCSTSTYSQDIEKQKKAILQSYPEATIMMDYRNHEADGLYENKWDRLAAFNKLFVDVLIMDSVTRMKCEPDQVFSSYEKFFNNGVELIFLKEPQLNSSVFREAEQEIDEMDVSEDGKVYFKNCLKALRKKQIEALVRLSIEDRERRSELAKKSISEAKSKGKQVGRQSGAKVKSLKEAPSKQIIRAHDKRFADQPGFESIWTTKEIMKQAGISRPTYKKYLKELIQEQIRMAVANKFKNRRS